MGRSDTQSIQKRHTKYERGTTLAKWTIAPTVVAISLLLYGVWTSTLSASLSTEQSPNQHSPCEEYPEDCSTNAPFIFDSLHSLLKQWPSSYGANGHSIVPVRLPPNTPLYHAKQWQGVPRKPTWFSFDP